MEIESWEYASVVVSSVSFRELIETLNNAGAKGWELVSITNNDPTVGANMLVAVLKRRIDPFEPPTNTSEGWKPDPSERHQYRWWDGECWTFTVADGEDESRDPPTRLTPAQRRQ